MKDVWWSGTGREQLFDLRKDPHELQVRGAAECDPYRSMLIDELSGRPGGFVRAARLVSGRPVGPVLPSKS